MDADVKGFLLNTSAFLAAILHREVVRGYEYKSKENTNTYGVVAVASASFCHSEMMTGQRCRRRFLLVISGR